MKKILIIVFVLLMIPSIKAASYNSNMTGITVEPSKNDGGSCNSSSYWIGFTQAEYKFQGLRISFYDEKGKQVGSTFDSWDWGDNFQTNYLQEEYFYGYGDYEKLTLDKIETITTAIENIEKEYEKIKDMNYISTEHDSYKKIDEEYTKIKGLSLLVVKYNNLLKNSNNSNYEFLEDRKTSRLTQVVEEGKYVKKVIEQLDLKNKIITANANNFDVYIKKTNHSLNYYSKVDYLSKGISADNADDFEETDLLDGGYYIFYHDTISHASNTKTRTWCKKADGTYGYCYEFFGDLLYSSQDAAKTQLRTYLTTESVMLRYLKIAGANNLIDIKEGNYTVLLEPVVNMSACRNGTYSGHYTSTDIGYVLAVTSPETNESLRKFPGWLKLERNINISGLNFTVADPAIYTPNYFYKPEEILSTLGTGMSAILGTEICKDNCVSGKRYPIVYRTFDLNNPFLNKDGTVRDLSEKSNWYDKKDSIETDIYTKEPFLVITLDPATIKAIRNDNKNIDYSALNKTTCSKFKTDFNSIFNPSIDFCN